MILWLHCAIVQCAQWIEILSARVSIYEKFILKYCQILVDHLEKNMDNKNMNALVDMTLHTILHSNVVHLYNFSCFSTKA